MDTLKYLNDKLLQLQSRHMMIPRYVKQPGQFLGKKDFSLNDLPDIEFEIGETQAAIKAVLTYRKTNKKKENAKSK